MDYLRCSDLPNVVGYKEVEVEDIEEPEETTDEDVNNYIEAVLTQYATQEEIKDREAKSGTQSILIL